MARLLGKYGRCWIGTGSGGSQTYASTDCEDWEITFDPEIEESEGLDDAWVQRASRVGKWEVTANKFVTTQQFLYAATQHLTGQAAAYFTGYRGGATAAGATVAQGQVVIGAASLTNGNGWMKENVRMMGTGALSVATN